MVHRVPYVRGKPPDGVPALSGVSQIRIETANKLYRFISVLVARCNALGILWCIENPNRSLFWATTPIAQLLQCPHLCTRFHHCMFGSQRRKHTLLCHSIPCVQALQVLCDDSHDHLPWGRLPDGGFATTSRRSLTRLSCASVLLMLSLASSCFWVLPPCRSSCTASLQPARAAQVATLHQPRKRLSEYESVVTVRGSAALVPTASTLPADWVLPPTCSSHPELRVLPAGSKRLSAFPTSGSPEGLEEQSCICVKFGIPWVPKDFVSQAVRCKHPKLLATALPGALKECIDYCISKTPVEVAQERTANLRKCLRAKDLKAEADEPLISQHCRDILANKSMRLLTEMIDVSGYGDSQLPKDIGRGFDLLGPIPDSSGVLPKKASFASLSVPEVREVANDNQRCVWQATMDFRED